VLLLDDDDELRATPGEAESTLAAELGPDQLGVIDAALLEHARQNWSKAARLVLDATKAGGHQRRMIAM